MAARALDVLEDRRRPSLVAVAEHVDVELDRVLEKAVDEARPFDGELPAFRATWMPRPPITWCGRTSTG